MTKKGPTKAVDPSFLEGRLRIARAYLKAARTEATMSEEGDIGNPAMSQVVNAAIAFTDALTAKYAGVANQQDHAAAIRALRDTLGNRLPSAQETRLRRILGEKDEIQYGTRFKTIMDAGRMLAQLEEFALWAEAELKRPR
ncbi:hypothetical protein N825_13220 [Skermanella stibiiresistens SB22]|uniref:HEPN domain-containing protein n=1 Tax=Skermanella stibiiresistens SB22 TaxID=1385369 RepID=W9GXA9_9PROT|nr:hypothetical protein [Skermanella stibiiresistens]EWY38444.1 hypothetical protein N825_13220 [Skermanella stibiiresistens SB22]